MCQGLTAFTDPLLTTNAVEKAPPPPWKKKMSVDSSIEPFSQYGDETVVFT